MGFQFHSLSRILGHSSVGRCQTSTNINPGNNLLQSSLYAFENGYVLPQAGFDEISLRYSSPASGVGSVELPQQYYWTQPIFTGDKLPENSEQISGEVINTDFEPSEQAGLMLIHGKWSAMDKLCIHMDHNLKITT